MPFLTDRKTQPSYDAIVVGSGAAGGQTAQNAYHRRRQSSHARGRPQLRPNKGNAMF